MILVNCIEGFSASTRDEWKTISHLVKNRIHRYASDHPDRQIRFNEVQSSSSDALDNSLRFLKRHSWKAPHNARILLTGKSMGGVKTWWLLRSRWKELRQLGRIYVLTIDPHGPIWGDGEWGPYDDDQPLTWLRSWDDHNALRLENVYQQDDYPDGARFIGANNTRFPDGADHFNITDVNSAYSALTKRKITEGLTWLSA